jgi:hypothetical protein
VRFQQEVTFLDWKKTKPEKPQATDYRDLIVKIFTVVAKFERDKRLAQPKCAVKGDRFIFKQKNFENNTEIDPEARFWTRH